MADDAIAGELGGGQGGEALRRLGALLEELALGLGAKDLRVSVGIENKPPGQRRLFGPVADNKVIAHENENRRFQSHLGESALAGQD